MSSVPRNQHIIPQGYLKRFSDDGDHIWMFDKKTLKTGRPNARNVASERDFYNLPEQEARKLVAPAIVETLLSRWDDGVPEVIEQAVSQVENGDRITDESRSKLAFIIVNFILRSRVARAKQRELAEGMIKAVRTQSERMRMPLPNDLRQNFDLASLPTLQAKAIFSMSRVGSHMASLLQHWWVFGRNDSNIPLYTSDEVVCVVPHASQQLPFGSAGIASPGIEILVPLDSKRVVQLYERRFLQARGVSLDRMDGRLTWLEEKHVLYANSAQVRWSYRQVYCERDEFDMVRTMCEETPELRDPERPRVHVDLPLKELESRGEE